MDLKPTLVLLRRLGGLRRYMLLSPPEPPQQGQPIFDYTHFFGYGGGEIASITPTEFRLKVRVEKLPSDPQIAKSIMAATLSRPTDQFDGFFTRDCEQFYRIVEDAEGVDLFMHKDLDWGYYATLGGDRDVAVAHIMSLNRQHFMYDTYEQQSSRLTDFAQLVKDF